MSREALQQVLDQMNNLDPEELEEVNRALQRRLVSEEPEDDRQRFYRALVESGLVLYVGERMRVSGDECPLAEAKGEPVSQMIIRERR